MQTAESIRQNLALAPHEPLRTTLVRLVPFVPLTQRQPPDWLFTSGKPNRYNLAGTECLYFATDEATARAEYAAYWTGLPAAEQPVATYCAEVR